MKNFTKVVYFILCFFAVTEAFATIPIFTVKQINSIGATSFTLAVQVDQAATVYYVVTTSPTAPTIAQVKTGKDEFGAAAYKSGNFPVASGTTTNQAITPVTSQTVYYIHFLAENSGAEQTTVQTLTATTLDNTPPSFISSSIINNTSGTQFDLRVNVSEISTIYYVVTTSATTPTKAQIRAGQDNTGAPAFLSGNFSAAATTNTTTTISPLSTATTYHVYFIAEDPSTNQSSVQSKTATTPTLPVFNSSSLSTITFTGFTLNVNVTMDATLYFVVTQSSTAPSIAQVMAGKNEVGGTPDASGNYPVLASTNDAHPIAGLSGATLYYIYFVAEDTNNNNTTSVQSKSATTKDPIAPTLSSFTPLDGATNVATTTTLVMTFDKTVIVSTTAPAAGSNNITLTSTDPTITIPRGSGQISIAGNVVTLTFSSALSLSIAYTVKIGANVFSNVDGVDYAGISSGTAWNFTTNAGATITSTTGSFCPSKFSALGSIVLTEVSPDNFHGTVGTTKTIVVGIDAPGFAFQPISASSPVAIPFTTGRDIAAAEITSASFTSATISITFASSGNVTDDLDQVTIQGLKILYDGSSPPPVHVIKTGGTLVADINPAPAYWATLNSSSASAAPTLLTTDLTYCKNENISATMVSATAVAGATFTWYSDGTLTNVLSSSTSASINVTSLGVSTASPVAFRRYLTQTESGNCEGPALTVDFTVTPLPVANAGADQTVANGNTQVCSDSPPVTLGGSPTLQSPSVPGAYTYSWASTPALIIAGTANPQVIITNSTAAIVPYQFTVTITDANLCQGTAVKNIDVKPAIVPQLVQPSSTTFSTNSAAQLLVANPAGGTFSGVGVIQSGTSTYKYAASAAYDVSQPLPQQYPVYYTVTSSGCTVTNYHVATMTLSNQLFSNISAQYCKSEHPTSDGNSNYLLSASPSAYTSLVSNRDYWNNYSRFYYPPLSAWGYSIYAVQAWQALGAYGVGARVNYGNVLYVAQVAINLFNNNPPNLLGPWAVDHTYEVEFNGTIRNYYEGYYGGNIGSLPAVSATVIDRSGYPQYSVGGRSFDYYEFLTNTNYANCPTCGVTAPDYPAFYLDFVDQTIPQLQSLLAWSAASYYYPGDVVFYNGSFYRQLLSYYNYPYWSQANPPDISPTIWKNEGLEFDNGQYYSKRISGNTKAGFYSFGQYVSININPSPDFSGLVSGNLLTPTEFCTTNTAYVLQGSQAGAVNFDMSYNGSAFGTKPGLVNGNPAPGQATFNPINAFSANPSASTVKQFYVRFAVDPGTTGSANQACTGYSPVQSINVNTSPTVTFISPTPVDGKLFCFNVPPVDIATTKTSTTAATVVLSGPGGISDIGNGTGKFKPGAALQGLEIINGVTYTYSGRPTNYNYIVATVTDANGCIGITNKPYTINPLPPASISGNPVTLAGTAPNQILNLCYNGGSTSLIGGTTNSYYDFTYVSTPTPYAWRKGSFSSPVKDFLFDPKVYYDSAVGKGANSLATLAFDVVYTTFDADQCKNTLPSVSVKVAANFPVTITGVRAADEFCANDPSHTVTLSPYPGNLTVKLNGVTIGNPAVTPVAGNGQFTFGPSGTLQTTLLGGDYSFHYDVITGTNCTNPTDAVVKVLPSPKASFTIPPKCKGDLIPFNGLDISGNVPGAPISPVIYTWNFEGVDTVGQVSQHRFTGAGTYSVNLKIDYAPSPTKNIVCSSQLAQDQVVGDIPKVDFDISNVCQGDATQLTGFPTNGVVISQGSWDFGDTHSVPYGTVTSPVTGDPTTSGNYGSPAHTFTGASAYTVKFSATSQSQYGSCLATKTRKVTILKYMAGVFSPSNPYQMKKLNNEDGFWSVEDRRDNSTWEFAAPQKSLIASANKFWVTNATGFYKSKDQSYVNSPCLDLSAYSRPSISINYMYNSDPNKDGAVLQYSLDGGASWAVLGNLIDGLEWYSTQNVSATPGVPFNQNGYGWSGTDQVTWKAGKHALNAIVNKPGNNKARLRIAFASDAKDTLDGFAFNDVRIEERNRTTLVENFTNESALVFAANNTSYSNIPITEAVKIQYHTAFPGNDPINQANSGDHDARAAFYGLTNGLNLIPRGYIDGGNKPTGNNQADFTQIWAPNYLPLRSLVNSPLAITISNPAATDNNQLALTVTLKGLTDVTSGQPKLYVGVVEKQLGNLVYVMRKMLPSASGTSLALPILKDAIITINLEPWEVKNISSISELAIVAFVQDEQTKDVLQSTIKMALDNPPTITTGLVSIGPEHVSIFPNPADRELLVELPRSVAHDTPVRLVDQVGHIVYNSEVKAGTSRKTIGTGEFSAGLYILQVGSDKASVARKKVMIVHEK
jgi:hypothetical protein